MRTIRFTDDDGRFMLRVSYVEVPAQHAVGHQPGRVSVVSAYSPSRGEDVLGELSDAVFDEVEQACMDDLAK